MFKTWVIEIRDLVCPHYTWIRQHHAGGIWKLRFHSEKALNVFVHTKPEELNTQQSLDLRLKISRTRISHDLYLYFHNNYTPFNGFLSSVFYNFQNLGKNTDVFAQKKFLEDIFNSEICYRYD